MIDSLPSEDFACVKNKNVERTIYQKKFDAICVPVPTTAAQSFVVASVQLLAVVMVTFMQITSTVCIYIYIFFFFIYGIVAFKTVRWATVTFTHFQNHAVEKPAAELKVNGKTWGPSIPGVPN
jgi:hypothetical protein